MLTGNNPTNVGQIGLASAPQKKESITILKIANGFTISFGYGADSVNYFPTIEDAMNGAKEYFG